MKKLEKKIEKFLTGQGYENVTFNKTNKWSDEEYIEVRADHVTKAWTYEGETKTIDDDYGKFTLTKGEHFPEERENNDIFRIYPKGKVNGSQTYFITWDGVSDIIKDTMDYSYGIPEVVDEFFYNTFDELEGYDNVSADILAV